MHRSGGGSHSSSSRRRSPSPRRRSPSPRRRSPSPRRRSPSPRRSSGAGGSTRRRSPSPRRRRDDSPSPPRKPRSDKELPTEFCRERDEKKDDNRNILERMEKSYASGPLDLLRNCVKKQNKLKVWTRNFKEVRGICTGFVVAFDKHWNLVMQDVDEIYLRAKKGKTPFLRELEESDAENIPEAKPRVPREKKPKPPAEEKPPEPEPMEGEGDKAGKPEKKKKKKKKSIMKNRHVDQLFLRGDNIVMLAVLGAESTEA